MIQYRTARKYLSWCGVIWERVDSTSRLRESRCGTLFHVEEVVVAGDKVTHLYIKDNVSGSVFEWNAAESRVVKRPSFAVDEWAQDVVDLADDGSVEDGKNA